MLTQNTGSASEKDVPSTQDDHTNSIEQKKSELLKQETNKEIEITQDQLSISKRLLNWRTIVPLIIAIVALVIFAQKININPKLTWLAMRNANVYFVLAAIIVYYFSFPIRTFRWRMLLENVGYTKENGIQLPNFWKLLEILYVSWFANVIVPAKLGDVYRAYLLRREAGLPASRTFGTILAERLLDLIILLLLFIPSVIISLHENLPPQLVLGLKITMLLVIVGIIGLFMLRMFPTQIGMVVPKRFRGYYYQFQEGTLGSFKRIPSLTGLTVGVWACEALRFFFIALALNLIPGNLTHVLSASLFIALGEALLTVIPFTGGGIGLVEGGMLAMISLFTPNTSLALAAIVIDRAISLFSILVIGFFVFMFTISRQASIPDQPLQNLTLVVQNLDTK
ncbi:MAG TPA: lysylphosphatidylglycerol synthase transmembrane domain-containing protein [Ktedonobacteraceae bacterium]|nr:lysylphosphatidylglycerol synthase transmembrane domain-containing protein [Ktedonobacteraceae bacterium]